MRTHTVDVGLLSKFFNPNKSEKKRTRDPSNDFWYSLAESLRFPGGQNVNATSAQRVAAAYACQVAITESIAMLPAGVYEEQDERTSLRRKDHYLDSLLRDQPNPIQDAFEWRESVGLHALHHGDAYCQIRRSKSRKIIEIGTPLDPTRMKVEVVQNEKEPLAYTYKTPSGGEQKFAQSEIFHFKPYSKDGIQGRTPIKVCADVFGFQLAVQTHGNALFENGTFSSGFIETPKAFESDEDRKDFMDSFKSILGARNSGKLGLLEEGTSFKQMSMNNRDAQLVELMNFGAIQLAMVYRMPPAFIQMFEKGMAFASVEQLGIMFVQYTIQPWGTRLEKTIKRQLLGDQPGFYLKFNVNALQRGDYKARIESIVQQIQYGLMTVNEGRQLEERNPLKDPNADKALISHNLKPIELVDQVEEPATSGFEAANEEEEEEPAPKQEKSSTLSRFEPLFQDLIGRLVRKELKAVRNAKKKDGWLKWAEGFLQEHRDLMEESLEPAVRAHADGGFKALYMFIDEVIQERQDMYLNLESIDNLKDDTDALTKRLISKLEETAWH